MLCMLVMTQSAVGADNQSDARSLCQGGPWRPFGSGDLTVSEDMFKLQVSGSAQNTVASLVIL